MMQYILGPLSAEPTPQHCHERYERQKLFEHEGRFYDILDFKPLNGTGVSETYYFDITKDYIAEEERLMAKSRNGKQPIQ